MNSRRTIAASILTGALLLTTACSNSDTAGDEATNAPGESAASESPATPVIPAQSILSAEDAPEGFTFDNVGAFIDEQAGADSDGAYDVLNSINDGTVTEPAQCSWILPTAVSVLLRVKDHRDQTEAVEYSTESGDVVITSLLTTDDGPRAPENLSECATFTRTIDQTQGGPSVTYTARPLDITVNGADSVTAAEVSADADATDSGTLIAGVVDGAYFHVHASGVVDPATVQQLAQAQVDKINQR